MRTFLALCTMIFLWCTALNAAPVTSDIGATNQTTIVAALDQPAVLPSFFSSSNIPDRDALPGIVAVASTNNSTANFSTTSDGGNSANYNPASTTWTAHDYDIGATQSFFFLSNTTACANSAQHPDYTLRC